MLYLSIVRAYSAPACVDMSVGSYRVKLPMHVVMEAVIEITDSTADQLCG